MKEKYDLPCAGLILALGLGLGAEANLLLYGQKPGLGWTLFLLTPPFVLLLVLRRCGIRPCWSSLAPLLGAYAFFAVSLTVRSSEFVTRLNAVACLLLGALIVRFALSGRLCDLRLAEILTIPFSLLGASLYKATPLVTEATKSLQNTDYRRKSAPLLRGLLLSSLVLLLFVPLLISADAVFAKRVMDLLYWLQPESWREQAGRVGLLVVTFWLTVGSLVHALTARHCTDLPCEEKNLPLGFIETMTVLSSVALVFGAFLSVQLTYLFGGAARVISVPGLTYAEYARRGFAELVTVSVLTLALTLCLKAFTRRVGKQAGGFSALATVIIAETLILLGSAWNRMTAYEAAYGATQTRLHVDVFIVWLGIALLWLFFTLWSRTLSARFAVGGVVCILGFVASLNVINLDALMVCRNSFHWSATGNLDYKALMLLSDDANPEIALLCRKLPDGEARRALEKELLQRKTAPKDWQSWHVRR